ncbi:DMT family transporter [Yoonia sp. MH D7]
MIFFGIVAVIGGLLVGLSRQLNGRLSMSTNAMESSFWNHIVGFVFVSLLALGIGGMFQGAPFDAPWWAYLGGPIGFVFIATGSWAIGRIGAAQTAMLIISGQMISGVLLDMARGIEGNPIARVIGVALIIGGMWVTRAAKEKSQPTKCPTGTET